MGHAVTHLLEARYRGQTLAFTRAKVDAWKITEATRN